MGTNYYHRTNLCPVCGRYDEHHIGKSSGGWTFSFHGEREPDAEINPLGCVVASFADWKKRLQYGAIFDEYEERIPFADFVALVTSKRDSPENRTGYVWKHHVGTSISRGSWHDPEGHSFSEGEFS